MKGFRRPWVLMLQSPTFHFKMGEHCHLEIIIKIQAATKKSMVHFALTDIHGCFRASAAVIRLDGLIVNILLMRSFASGVTVSHSGEGNCKYKKIKPLILSSAGEN